MGCFVSNSSSKYQIDATLDRKKQVGPRIIKGQKKGWNSQHFQDLSNLVVEPQVHVSTSQGYKLANYITCNKQLQLLHNQYIPMTKSLINQKKLFQDKKFAPQYKSLTNRNAASSKISGVSSIKWKHYSEIYKSPQLFDGRIEPNDIDQGSLGDCYFLCSLASLAEYSKLIQRLFEYYDLQFGYFLIWLCIDGHWKLYEIDGYIPVRQDNRPVFGHGTNQQLWVLLLEKAYAKAYGSYEHIIGGISYEAIKDVSGAPGQSFDHQQNSKDLIWNKLIYANKHSFIMTCGTDRKPNVINKQDGHAQNITKEGIVLGHAYSILDVTIYENQKLIQLRNPWGDTEWKGDWSDESKKWTAKAKVELNYNDSNDGIFWMPFQAYMTRYSTTAINYIRPSYFYTSETRSAIKNILIKIESNSFKHGFVMICQHDYRAKGLPINTPYSLCNLMALTYKNGNVIRKISEQTYLYQREGSVELVDIQEGVEIIIMVDLEQAAQVQLCTYADTKLQYQIYEDADAATIYLQGLAKIEPSQRVTINEDYKSWMANVKGLAFFVFKNTSNKSYTINLQLKGPNNICVFKGSKHIIKMEVGGIRCITGRIIDLSNSFGFGKYSFYIDYENKG